VAARLAAVGGAAHRATIEGLLSADADRGVQLTAAAALLAMPQGTTP
jgi:hypothetical protein